MTVTAWIDDITELTQSVRGPLYTRDTPGYDAEVAVFNTAVRHRPAIVVGAVDAADVSKAVRFASRHDLSIAVLNTGHGPAVAAGSDTLLITTKRMSGVTIDSSSRTARVEAGVRFGQLVTAAARFGLAPLPGSSPGVGVVGYTLSGGASLTMGRKFGWAADHVSEMDVVTADGRRRRVSANSDADLFGALLGGRGNFGVVTAMECELFPVTRLYAGALFYSGQHLQQVLDAYRELTDSAPDELTTSLALLNFVGPLTVSVRTSYLGDSDAGARLLEPLRGAAPLQGDTVADIPYSGFASISNDPEDPAAAVEQFGLLSELTEDTVAAIVDVVGPQSHSPINIVDFRHLQGAYSRPGPVPNAVGARDAAFAFFGLTVVPPGHDPQNYRHCGYELVTALQPWLHPQASPSFQGPNDAGEARTRRAYDPVVYDRLRAVKAAYDPHNRFRINHNIPPV